MWGRGLGLRRSAAVRTGHHGQDAFAAPAAPSGERALSARTSSEEGIGSWGGAVRANHSNHALEMKTRVSGWAGKRRDEIRLASAQEE